MDKKRVLGTLLLFIGLITILLLVYTLVLGKAGLSNPDVERQLNFYVNLIMVFGIGTMAIVLLNFLWKRNNQYGDSIGFFNIGNKPSLKFFKKYSPMQLYLLSLIFFFGAFLIANMFKSLGSGFFGMITLPQNIVFTNFDKLLVSGALVPTGENLMASFSIGLIILLITIIAIKLKWSETIFKQVVYLSVPILLGILGFIWHQSVYANSDVASMVTAVFWAIGGLITILTGFFLVFWNLHYTNNFFIEFQALYSSDVLFATAIGVLITLILTYWYFYINKGTLFGRKSKEVFG